MQRSDFSQLGARQPKKYASLTGSSANDRSNPLDEGMYSSLSPRCHLPLMRVKYPASCKISGRAATSLLRYLDSYRCAASAYVPSPNWEAICYVPLMTSHVPSCCIECFLLRHYTHSSDVCICTGQKHCPSRTACCRCLNCTARCASALTS